MRKQISEKRRNVMHNCIGMNYVNDKRNDRKG